MKISDLRRVFAERPKAKIINGYKVTVAGFSDKAIRKIQTRIFLQPKREKEKRRKP